MIQIGDAQGGDKGGMSKVNVTGPRAVADKRA